MTTFVVLAAGRGSRLGRLGDALPKCLLPLNGRAVLSHQFALAPVDARLVVVTGYRDLQVMEYVRLAHPHLDVTFVHDDEWGSGPGASLLAAREAIPVDDDLVFTACDTLWECYDDIFDYDGSWVAVAPVPAGTPDARWCRVKTDVSGEFVEAIYDKVPDVVPGAWCWTALARIANEDLAVFWEGLEHSDSHAGELQLSAGLGEVVKRGQPVEVRQIAWLDVGDEQAFRQATATLGGYDSLKPDQVTYVDRVGSVVKFHVNRDKIRDRVARARLIGDAVPQCVETLNGTMTAYDYVEGQLAYDAVEGRPNEVLTALLDWWHDRFWVTHQRFAAAPPANLYEASSKFYRDRTFERVASLDPLLRNVALDAITRVDWEQLVDGVVPGVFHGDFTLANVVTWDDDWNLKFRAIDWREDYAGVVEWGDLRYDLAKLLTSARFHWQRASYGDFRRWSSWGLVESVVESQVSLRFPSVNLNEIRVLAALCLLNSAALHAAPMDEILVARGTHWLETLT